MKSKTRYFWMRGTVVSVFVAASFTVWILALHSPPPSNWPILTAIISLGAGGCLAPFVIGRVAKRYRYAAAIVTAILLWGWWMFFFNGMALFIVPIVVSTAWMADLLK